MSFSLVVATIGRDRELAELFDSLLRQPGHALDVIVVDQNGDDRLVPVIARYADRLPIRHRRATARGANPARNLGLRMARHELVCFPDDDCTLPDGVLDRAAAAFAADPALQLLTGPAASPAGGLGSGRWRQEAGPITLESVWTSVIEFNLFLRRETALALGGFDERLGPGTPLGSAEGNDLVCRALAAGHKALYDPALRILHPDKRLTPVAVQRAELYGRGLGFVMRRHRTPAAVVAPFFIRPLGGIALSLVRGRLLEARYYRASLAGRLAGWRDPMAAGPATLTPLTPESAP